MSVETLLAQIQHSGWDGVTVSGGEPFLQPRELAALVRGCKRIGKNVWVYTGYTLEYLEQLSDEHVTDVLNQADVLVDGRFVESMKDRSLRFRGSRNQRIIFLNKV